MVKINTHAAKTNLSALLLAVETRGETYILCRGGQPIAELRPLAKRRDPLTPHPKLSKVVFHGDPMAPLDPSDWPLEAR